MIKSHGKKVFPGSNSSNIFFVDNQKNNKLDLNKYINKPNKKNITNKTIKDDSINSQNLKMPIKKRVLKKCNSITLKKGNFNLFTKQNEIIKKRQLVSHRSVDYFNTKKNNNKKMSLTEPNISETTISKDLKQSDLTKVKVKHRILGNNNLNRSYNCKTSRESSKKTFTTLAQRIKKEPITSRRIETGNFYDKFINKNKTLNDKNNKINKNLNLKSARNYKYQEPKEEVFIIKKEKLDGNIIDIKSLKKNILGKGISIVSLTGISSSLDPINKDSVKLILNSNDVDKTKLDKIGRILKSKGLKFNELKNNYNKKIGNSIFPAKSKWNDNKFGGRENREKLQLSMEHQKNKKENKFLKKSTITKQNYFDVTYKNNQIKRNKSAA